MPDDRNPFDAVLITSKAQRVLEQASEPTDNGKRFAKLKDALLQVSQELGLVDANSE